jgi:hypothetical protein
LVWSLTNFSMRATFFDCSRACLSFLANCMWREWCQVAVSTHWIEVGLDSWWCECWKWANFYVLGNAGYSVQSFRYPALFGYFTVNDRISLTYQFIIIILRKS